jgi:hypothetical protein
VKKAPIWLLGGLWANGDCVFSARMQEFRKLWVKVERSGRTRLWPFSASTSTPWMRKGV